MAIDLLKVYLVKIINLYIYGLAAVYRAGIHFA